MQENDEKYSQKEENELKKIKLALEHGMDLSKSFPNPDLPPEVEGEFLDYIQQWEEQFASGKQVKVYDFIHQPAYKPVAEVSDDDMAAELKKLQDILLQYSIHLDTLCPVDDKELYRFITEELFDVEMNEIRIEGMMHGFIYEEFHPNHEYDIKSRCQELVSERLLSKEWDGEMITGGMNDQVEYQGRKFTKEELNEKMMHFRDSFSSFDVQVFELVSVVINDAGDAAAAVYDIEYAAVIDGSPEIISFTGQCIFDLHRNYDWWRIHKMSIPGLTV